MTHTNAVVRSAGFSTHGGGGDNHAHSPMPTLIQTRSPYPEEPLTREQILSYQSAHS